jgi:hypothetical protein
MKPPSNGPRPKSNETKKPEASSELQYTGMKLINTSKWKMSKTCKINIKTKVARLHLGLASHNLTNF